MALEHMVAKNQELVDDIKESTNVKEYSELKRSVEDRKCWSELGLD